MPRSVMPAHADEQLLRAIPLADASVVHPADGTPAQKTALRQAPSLTVPAPTLSPCGVDRAGPPIHFDPQTGQPCDSLPQERVVVHQPPAKLPALAVPPLPSMSPEDHALLAAWQLEHEAMLAPLPPAPARPSAQR
jgi:hypothetical protein